MTNVLLGILIGSFIGEVLASIYIAHFKEPLARKRITSMNAKANRFADTKLAEKLRARKEIEDERIRLEVFDDGMFIF